MKFQNNSGMRQSIVIAGQRTQLLDGDVVESDRDLKFAFLEKVDEATSTTVQPGKRFSSVLNLQQKVSSLESQREHLSQTSSGEIQKLTEDNTRLKEEIASLSERQESLEGDTARKLEMMKSAIMMIQEDFYNVAFDDQGKAVEKDATFRPK